MKVKILHVITLSETGGAQRIVEGLVRGLVKDGRFDVTLACGPGEDLVIRLSDCLPGDRIVRLKHMRRPITPIFDALGYLELFGLIRSERYDIVHCHSTKAGVLGRMAAATAAVKGIVFTAHGWSFSEGVSPVSRAVYILAEKLAARLTDRILCVSEYDRRLGLAVGIHSRGDLTVLKNGIDLAPYLAGQRDDWPSDRPVRLCTVGRLADAKDPETLIRALGLLRKRVGDRFSFDFIGDGPLLRKVSEAVRTNKLDDLVHFLGNRSDVPTQLFKHDVFVLSSSWEGLPVSVMEAMAAGLPVVATNVGGVPELVESGVSGLLSPRRDPHGLASNLERLIVDPSLRRSLGDAGRKRALANFGQDRMVQETITNYLELVRR